MDRWVLGDGVLDLARREFHRDGRAVELTALEAGLLRYLAANAGRAVPRDELQLAVWGHRKVLATRAVDNTVSRLRRKIERDPAEPRHLRSHRGGGYSLVSVVADPSSPAAQPPEAPGSRAPGLMGREAALGELARALEEHHAIVLTGPGGVGKTRLAAEHAARAGGATVVGLAGCRDGDAVCAAVAAALGVDAGGGAAGRERLARVLAVRGGLLVLDGGERSANAIEELVGALVAGAPAMRVIVTSRLRLPSLVEVPVGPLADADAVALFRQRAPSAADGPDLRALLVALEGLPLAIELAAARVWMFSVPELRARLAARFALLAPARTPAGTLPALRTVIAWSWDLLEEPAREALARLAVFRGGFTAAAAEAVLGPELPALPLLEQLHDHSLLRAPGPATAATPPRLALFDAVRDFVEEIAGRRPEAETRHADWLVAQGRAASSGRRYPPALEAEADNLGVALERMEPLDPDRFAGLVRTAKRCRALAGDARARLALVERAIGLGPSRSQLASLLAERANYLHHRGQRDRAEADAQEAIRVGEDTGNDAARAGGLSVLSSIRFLQGQFDDALRQGRLAVELSADPSAKVVRLTLLADCLAAVGRRGDGVDALEEGYRLARAVSDGDLIAYAALELAKVVQAAGRLDAAERLFDEALHESPAEVEVRWQVLLYSGLVKLVRGDPDGARTALEQARTIAERYAFGVWREAAVEVAFAQLAWATGEAGVAVRRFDRVLERYAAIGHRESVAVFLAWKAIFLADTGDLDGAREALAEARRRDPPPIPDLEVAGLAIELRTTPDRGRLDAVAARLRELRPDLPALTAFAVHRLDEALRAWS